MSSFTDSTRLRALNDAAIDPKGKAVLYVMSRDQRVRDNPALVLAQQCAIDNGLPLVVMFNLQPKTGVRAREHYEFMLEGLKQVEKDLQALQIGFHLTIGSALKNIPDVVHKMKPAAVFFDMSPLRGPRKLHHHIAENDTVAVFEVDAHNVVPVWQASDKFETGARTLRPKITRQLADYLDETHEAQTHANTFSGALHGFADHKDAIVKLLAALPSNGTDLSRFTPGERAADEAIDDFITKRLQHYANGRNDPVIDGQSELNPYLHYGQLASARVVRAVQAAAAEHGSLREGADALTEEMVVRKELSDNFCYYNKQYDSLRGAPNWAQTTLDEHRDDERTHVYTLKQFEQAQTHDDAWNAAQRQLLKTGKMHGYMRMYWAKKVLEWTNTPEQALKVLLYLNDRYHVDGGDPNGYVGILWSIAGVHDRPWFERPVYGKVRYMNANGLRRKFDFDTYVQAHVPEADRVGFDS